jgi:hypothetical protein
MHTAAATAERSLEQRSSIRTPPWQHALAVAVWSAALSACSSANAPYVLKTGVEGAGVVLANANVPLLPEPPVGERKQWLDRSGPFDEAMSGEMDQGFLELARDNRQFAAAFKAAGPMCDEMKVCQEMIGGHVCQQMTATSNLFWKVPVNECLDTFSDLLDKHTVVIVAVSGGGSRSLSFAASVVGQLEETFNALTADFENDVRRRGHPLPSLFETVDVWSTVSGGSLFAYWMAVTQERINRTFPSPNEPGERKAVFRDFFRTLRASASESDAFVDPGYAAGRLELSRLPLLPLSMWVDRGFSSSVTDALEMGSGGQLLLGQLSLTPRFFFNATALPAQRPLLITRSTMLGKKGPLASNYRHDINTTPNPCLFPHSRPVCGVDILDDLGSSPAHFPLAAAAVASAGFPFALGEVPIKAFTTEVTDACREMDSVDEAAITDEMIRACKAYPANRTVWAGDGGKWDNSGLTTALDLVEHLAEVSSRVKRNLRRIVLISINADIATRSMPGPLSVSVLYDPGRFKGKSGKIRRGVTSMEEIAGYSSNRGLESVGARLVSLKRKREEGEVTVDVLPFFIALSQLAPTEPNATRVDPKGANRIWNSVASIATDLVIRPEEETALGEAATVLLNSEQPQGIPAWLVGPPKGRQNLSSERRLGPAITYALVRSSQERWPMDIPSLQ